MFPTSIEIHWLATAFLRMVDGIALLYLILLLWIPFYWFVFHPAIGLWRRLGRRSFWMAIPVWLTFAMGILLSRHILFAHRFRRNALTWVLGGLLFLVASWLERETRHTFGWKRLVGLAELNPQHSLRGVVRSGVYARIRHPRYLLYMLTIVSMAFLTGAPAIFLLAFLNVLMYEVLTPIEERELVGQYGSQYDEYRRLVPRFIPRPGRPQPSRPSS